MLAAVLATDDLRRLYAALSLLVSTAAAGEEARGLVSFAALEPLLLQPAKLAERARSAIAAPGLNRAGRERFATTLGELRTAAAAVAACELWACAAAVECSGADRAAVEDRLDGVISTPRFLTEVAGARLVVF